jgi:hypothetical protein
VNDEMMVPAAAVGTDRSGSASLFPVEISSAMAVIYHQQRGRRRRPYPVLDVSVIAAAATAAAADRFVLETERMDATHHGPAVLLFPPTAASAAAADLCRY